MKEAHVLRGKEIAEELQTALHKEIKARDLSGDMRPKIVALSVGSDEASHLYLKNQKRAAERVGIIHEIFQFPVEVTEKQLIDEIHRLNNNRSVHGIIIQMPLPPSISLGKVYGAIDPLKDVEGIHANNLGLLVLRKGKLSPCTALAVMELIEHSGIDLYGAETVIVGAGKVVGRPLSLMLMEKMATVTVCNVATSEKHKLEEHVRRADLVVAAAGKARLVLGEWIKEGAVVIDVGINHVDGKVVGDVDFDTAKKRARVITPVPGGVGPLTVTILMRNVWTAYKLQNE